MKNKLTKGLQANEIERRLEQKHRDAMLDLILVWASLDGALSMLASKFLGVGIFEATTYFDRTAASCKFFEIIKVTRSAAGSEDLTRFFKRHKKMYERYSRPRNHIAHAHCAGHLKRDSDYIVFAVFEKVGEDKLAVDAVPIGEMERATKWGRAFLAWTLKVIDKFDADEAKRQSAEDC